MAMAMATARRRSASASDWLRREERAGVRVRLEELQCCICCDVLAFPVTLPCGHNFDRGCILTAWEFEAEPRAAREASEGDSSEDDEPSRGAADQGRISAHSCPLCRQSVWLEDAARSLQVNRSLQGVVEALFPIESARVASDDKHHPSRSLPPQQQHAAAAAGAVDDERYDSGGGGLAEFLRRPSLRTLSSLVSVSVASLYTVPPGFTLAVLLLLVLTAVACTPPASVGVATSSAASPMLLLVLEAMDRLCNGLALLIRDLSLELDKPLTLVVHLLAVLW